MKTFTCPRCNRTSYHPKDLEHGWCSACQDFTAPAQGRIETKACVRSGECCKASPCAIGEVDPDKGYCKYLAQNPETKISTCLRYEEFKDNPDMLINPAFGAGCCRTLFNETRELIINRDHQGVAPVIEIDSLEVADRKMRMGKQPMTTTPKKKLSTGLDSTLGNYRLLTMAFFGSESKAVAWLDKKIEEAPNGKDEEVIANERQMLAVIVTIHNGASDDFIEMVS